MKNKKLTTEEFIKKAKIIHGDKYDYSLTNYINIHTKVTIICSKHSFFYITPGNHLSNKRGCKQCGYDSTSNKNSKDKNYFMEKSKIIHNDKYDYSLFNYTKSINKSIIICPIHGEFKQDAHNHLKGKGCMKCGGSEKLNTLEFIKLSKISHGDTYDYSKSDYINAKTKIKITCPKHGEFEQLPRKHMYEKNGCPICRESKGEVEIRKWLTENNIKFISQKKFKDCKNIKTLPFDFYLPEHNMCIEYNGEQHYKPINNWGGEEKFKLIKNRDKIKAQFCKKNKIELKIISYNQKIRDKLFYRFNNTPLSGCITIN